MFDISCDFIFKFFRLSKKQMSNPHQAEVLNVLKRNREFNEVEPPDSVGLHVFSMLFCLLGRVG